MAKMGFCRAAGSAGREADIHSVNCSYTYLPARPSTLDKPLNTNILCKVSYNKYSCQHWTNIHSVNCSYTYLPARLSTLDKHFLHSCTPTLYYHTKKMQLHIFAPFPCQHWTNISCTIEHQHYIIIQKNKKCSYC